ncbi:MAG TPA: protein kinase [Polyangiaceae bacterium]|jgi:tRNA A-37 threonylcarbamoyl transferase component Bud32|nr:protein kinase [Polyangiaceae bacterium]
MVEAAARRGRLPELAKYEALEEIGHGGMATVYRARDKRLGREVALKVIHPHLRNSVEVASRFFAEAKAVAKLRHPSIVEVYDVSEATEPDQYLVVELVRGITLRQLLRQESEQGRGAMPPEVAAAVALEVSSALAHANACGVVHRDVKPENVLIEHHPAGAASPDSVDPGQTASRVAVKLTDFGIAKLLDAQGVTSTGQVLGSPAHMAPEQIEGGDVDARSDVFGLGVLLYECMVGQLPFQGTNPAQVLRRVLEGQYPPAFSLRPLVGARWSAILDRALAHAPADRFSNASAVADALRAELDRLGFTAPLRELAAWLDEPAAYATANDARIIERLRALGDDARKRRDMVAAANDYNRALAYAPDDPQLMRIVAGLYRAEARARAVRRGAFAFGLAACLGMGLWGANLLRGGTARTPDGASSGTPAAIAVEPRAGAVAEPSGPGPLPASQSAGAPAESNGPATAPVAPASGGAPRTGADAVPVASTRASSTAARAGDRGTDITVAAGASSAAAPKPRDAIAARPIERTLTLDLKPPMGVDVALDGQPARSVSTGDALSLDGNAHALIFSCPVCAPVEVPIAAGDKNDRLVVSVPIKPATLVVEGNAAKTYQIAQHPELTVRAGTNTIALKSAFEHVTVKEIESGTVVSVRLEAGKSVRVSFE